MDEDIDCVVVGSCVADVLCRPVALDRPLGADALLSVEPIALRAGGIVANAGVALARIGLRVAALSYVGDDDWGAVLRRRLAAEGIDAAAVRPLADAPTSVTVVAVDADGRRSLIHSAGAPRRIDAATFRDARPLLRRSRALLLGYYPLLPHLLDALPQVLAEVRGAGCRIALETAADGGPLEPLRAILPHVDVYVPSHAEAARQTGEDDPEAMIAAWRRLGAAGWLGVKLGSDGAVLSPRTGQILRVPALAVPGREVVDTTGAGDAFCAGLLGALLLGLRDGDAGRFAAAVAAYRVTALGGSAGVPDRATCAALAGLASPGLQP